ncbi:hypothetical protein BIY24_02735 [Halobacteriovorax marinus]|uniref:Uncharacterized protein n=1 Tax=Halobacteriovorax marinus (strain ATCC BAA-682 / DSM 15412 / SJ) TaxID=862908 RepID=E1X4M8_HALMS|nr:MULTISPECIES: hypothetical protein [Halobacteriovorax]ATH06889.1 hypothetical protein BIY24_02735 [Halobacteriovorax marinus]PIK14895.1 MAG: hypothetical protein CES88_11220 [Halobacteriovorax sp. JY17]CBW25458.1 conserved hypothetical protein [Halobacteriovorax marinus SJ]
MSQELDFRFEKFEEYYGDIDQVKKHMDNCNICNAKLVQTHLSDFKNLIVQETARCPECGQGNKKMIHIIN